MNIEINKKINTSSVIQAPTSSPISKENDGKFASELRSLSAEKESKPENNSQKIEKTDVVKEDTAVKTIETTPKKEKITTEDNTKTDKKGTENVKNTGSKETNKTETVEKQENSFSKQEEKPEKLQAEKTDDAVLFPKNTKIVNEFEKIGEVKDISEPFEKNIDQKIIFENKQPNIKNEKVIDTNEHDIDVKKPILKDEEVLTLKSFENKDKFDINKQNKITHQEVKPEPQVSISQSEQKIEQNDEILKSEKTSKHQKNIKHEARQNHLKKQDSEFDSLVKTNIVKEDNEEFASNNKEINVHDEIDETLAATTRVITGLENVVKEIKQKTSVTASGVNDGVNNKKAEIDKEILINNVDTTNTETDKEIKPDFTRETKQKIIKETIQKKSDKQEKIIEQNSKYNENFAKNNKVAEVSDLKQGKSKVSEKKDSEDRDLIDNNVNIQEKKDILLPQMNTNMNFNSNGQPFSDFINQNKKEDELKTSQKDLEEEKAILSTMTENMAIANKNIVKKVDVSKISEENKPIINSEPQKQPNNRKTDNNEVEYKKVNDIFEPVNNSENKNIEKPKAEIEKPVEETKVNVDKPKVEVKKPIEQPKVIVNESKVEVKRQIEQPKVNIEKPKVEIKDPVEETKTDFKPKKESEKHIEVVTKTVEHKIPQKEVQDVQPINDIKVINDNSDTEKQDTKTTKSTSPVIKNEKKETLVSTIVEDTETEEQSVQPKTKTVTTDEGVKKVDKQTNITVETVVKYETVVMDKSDVDFFAKLVENGEVEMREVQKSQKSANVSKTLADMLAKAMQDNKPVRIDFDNNISIIIKIGRDGKISADFLPSSQIAETYLKENLPLLRQRFDDNNIEYDSLNQRKQNNKDNQENRRKGRKNE